MRAFINFFFFRMHFTHFARSALGRIVYWTRVSCDGIQRSLLLTEETRKSFESIVRSAVFRKAALSSRCLITSARLNPRPALRCSTISLAKGPIAQNSNPRLLFVFPNDGPECDLFHRYSNVCRVIQKDALCLTFFFNYYYNIYESIYFF